MKQKRGLLLLSFLLAIVIINVCCFNMSEYLTFDILSKYRNLLKEYVLEHPILAPLAFIGIYILSTTFSVPGAAILSITGGFLFPQPLSTLYVLIGATTGATLLFLAAKTILYDLLEERVAPYLYRMRAGFQENQASYMLFLRLVPVFPFWLVNLAPAFLHVRLTTFIWTTLIGIIPGAFVFTQAGAGLDAVFDAETLSIDAIFNRNVKIALIALGFFALIPIIIKKSKGKG